MASNGAERPDAPPSVLIVDDDPTSRVLAGAALQGHAGSMVEAENGLAALQAMEKQDFDIAILDIDMPVMDGFGVIERARARPATRHLPIIVTTGRDDVVSIERAFALGATSFVCKPINWNVFRHQVAYVLAVAKAERKARKARERADQVATFREQSLAALAAEVEIAIARISFLSGKGPEASLADIFASGEKLQAALSRIRRASELVSGGSTIEFERTAAGEVAGDAIARIGTSFGPDTAARIEVRGEDGLELYCDRALAAEALYEILANALAASPRGQPVSVAVVAAPVDRVRFEIADRGPGLPTALPGRDGSAHAANGGLGLAIAKGIVARHGGHFGIMSEPGRGTEVFLSFPVPRPQYGERSVGETPRIFPNELGRTESTAC
jgi:CheY-like chemotaxis protein